MPRYTLNIPTGGARPSTETLSSEWFGAVNTGFRPMDGFDESAEALDIGLVRWPGGTLSEVRTEVYGLEHEGLFDATDLWRHNPNRDRPDLAESMDYAIENDMAFSMIVPTLRYSDGNLAQGEAHLRDFLDDLFTGQHGPLPENFTLELGNEYWALDEFRDDPGAYGEIASSFAEIIGEAMDTYLTPAERAGINVAVQMGHDNAADAAIMAEMSPEALESINSLVFHSLPISLRNLNKDTPSEGGTRYEQWEARAERWAEAIEDAGGTGDPELFMSAWTVGSSTQNPDRLDLEWHDLGMRSASVAVESVAGFSSIGVDAAAIWGVDVTDPVNRVTTTENGALELSFTGHMFDMMAESLPGSTYLGTFTPHSRDDDVMSWSFGNGNRITTYVGINEFNPNNDDVHLDFGGADVTLISAQMLSSDLDPSYTGAPDALDARLHEVPVRYDITGAMARNGMVVDFNESYEIAEIVVELNGPAPDPVDPTPPTPPVEPADPPEEPVVDPSDGVTGARGADLIEGTWRSDHIHGHGGDDRLYGHHGYDVMLGGKGNDTIHGENGNDRLYGNDGDDVLYGGTGNDLLNGGAGRDVLIGGAGRDVFQYNGHAENGAIRDFEFGTDRIDMRAVFEDAGTLNIRSAGSTTTLSRGAGETWDLAITQSGEDAILRVLDSAGTEQLSVRVRHSQAEDLASGHESVFAFGEGFGAVIAPPQPVSPDTPGTLWSGHAMAFAEDILFERSDLEVDTKAADAMAPVMDLPEDDLADLSAAAGATQALFLPGAIAF